MIVAVFDSQSRYADKVYSFQSVKFKQSRTGKELIMTSDAKEVVHIDYKLIQLAYDYIKSNNLIQETPDANNND